MTPLRWPRGLLPRRADHDFDQRTGHQLDAHGRACREVGLVQPGHPRLVHLVLSRNGGQVNGSAQDPCLVGARFSEKAVDLGQCLFGLLLHRQRIVVGDNAG